MYKLKGLFLILLDPVFANFICSVLHFLNHRGSKGHDLPGLSHPFALAHQITSSDHYQGSHVPPI